MLDRLLWRATKKRTRTRPMHFSDMEEIRALARSRNRAHRSRPQRRASVHGSATDWRLHGLRGAGTTWREAGAATRRTGTPRRQSRRLTASVERKRDCALRDFARAGENPSAIRRGKAGWLIVGQFRSRQPVLAVSKLGA